MTPLRTLFREKFIAAFKFHSSKDFTNLLHMNLPSIPTGSLATDFKNAEGLVVKEGEAVASLFTYDVKTAYTHIKSEVTKLEDFIISRNKTISSNTDKIKTLGDDLTAKIKSLTSDTEAKIKALTDENTSHTLDVATATDTVTKLKPIVGL